MTEPRKAFVARFTENDNKIELMVGPGDHSCERWEISGLTALSLYRDLHKIIIDRVKEADHARWWLTEGRGR